MSTELIQELKKFLIVTLGTFLLASGVAIFFAPNQIVTGGPPGIGIILLYVLGIPVGLTVFIINVLLIFAGAKRYGRAYVIRTLYAVFMVSVFIELVRYLLPATPILEYTALNVLLGAIMIGFGIAICFEGEAASGGMATLAQLIAERTGISLGRIIQIIDGSIVLFSGLVFKNIGNAIWGAIGVLIAGFIIDGFMRRRMKRLKGRKS